MTKRPTVAWCSTSRLEDCSLQPVILEIAASLDWVTEFHLQITDTYGVDTAEDKLHVHYGFYGTGYSRPTGRGGFMGIHAFNDALRWGRLSGCDWVLYSDSDEFFTDELFEHIVEAAELGASAIWAPRWNLVDLDHYIDPTPLAAGNLKCEQPAWRHPGDYMDMPYVYDPAMIGWNNKLLHKFGFEQASFTQDPTKNWHGHQATFLLPARYDDPIYFHVAEGVTHVHMRQLFYPTREFDWLLEKHSNGWLEFPGLSSSWTVPEAVRSLWDEQSPLRDGEPALPTRIPLSYAEKLQRISPGAAAI